MSAGEQSRIKFIEHRDGKEAALIFVRATYVVYRRSLMQSRKRGFSKPHHASIPEYRRGFIESCVEFRRYLCSISPKPEIVEITT